MPAKAGSLRAEELMKLTKSDNPPPVVREYKPAFNIRQTKNGRFELSGCASAFAAKRQPRRAIEAVVEIAGDTAKVCVRRRNTNYGAVLTMVQMLDAKVARLVTGSGQLLAGKLARPSTTAS